MPLILPFSSRSYTPVRISISSVVWAIIVASSSISCYCKRYLDDTLTKYNFYSQSSESRVQCNILTRIGGSGRRILVIHIRVTVSAKGQRVPIHTYRVADVGIPPSVAGARVAVVESIGISAGSRRVPPTATNRISVSWIPIARVSVS